MSNKTQSPKLKNFLVIPDVDRESTWILGSRLRLMLRRGEASPRMTSEGSLSADSADSLGMTIESPAIITQL